MADNNIPVLDVKNLRISFTTMNGTVKAVRGIDYTLYKGRTLAIVGESGSGKSVSTKAIMGLLAGNKIIEEGQILFDGMDLLKLSEEDFVRIRGSRISMIFQDPMSSLNPIMRVGRQLTEAMILKNKNIGRLSKKATKGVTNAFKAYEAANGSKDILAKTDELISKPLTLANNNKKAIDGYQTKIAALEAKLEKKENEEQKAELEKLKAELEAFKANNVYEFELSEEDRKTLSELYAPVVEYFEKTTKEARQKAYDFLVSLRETAFIDNEYHNEVIKEAFKLINTHMKASLMPYRVEKDNLLSTFYLQIKSLYKKYKKATKKYAKDLKVEAKLQEKEAEGVDVSNQRLKIRSFSSEIVTNGETVAQEVANLLDACIAHLKELIESDDFSATKEADYLIDSLIRIKKDALSTISGYEAKKRAISLLEEVGIPQPKKRFKQYPFELSGGMRQRIVIAIALASNPEILICDEPTTALDVTIQAQILELIKKIKEERNLSVIFITHNLGVVANMADDIAVMYAGKIVEYAEAEDLFYDPRHPYTWALLASMPDLNTKERLHPIKGTPPNMILPPKGDAFAPRNEFALNIDLEEQPPMFKVGENHYVASWLVAPGAPKVELPKIVTERIRVMKERNKKNA